MMDAFFRFTDSAMRLQPSSYDDNELLYNVLHGDNPEQQVKDCWDLYYRRSPQWVFAFDALAKSDSSEVVFAVLTAVFFECIWRHEAKLFSSETKKAVVESCRAVKGSTHLRYALEIRACFGDLTLLQELPKFPDYSKVHLCGLLGGPDAVETLRGMMSVTSFRDQKSCAQYLARNGCRDGEQILEEVMCDNVGCETHMDYAAALANVQNPIGCAYILAILDANVRYPRTDLVRDAIADSLKRPLNRFYMNADLSKPDWPEDVAAQMRNLLRDRPKATPLD